MTGGSNRGTGPDRWCLVTLFLTVERVGVGTLAIGIRGLPYEVGGTRILPKHLLVERLSSLSSDG